MKKSSLPKNKKSSPKNLAAKSRKPAVIKSASTKSTRKTAKTTPKRAPKTAAVSKTDPKQRLRFGLSVGMLFILAGALLAYQPLMRLWHEKQLVANAPAPAPPRTPEVEAATKVNDTVEGKPVRLVVPSLGIDVPVADGFYNSRSQTWTLSNNKAHFATEMTPQPNNQGGNTFIYGHNRPEVFARLGKLKVGEKATVYTDNSHVFTYVYRSAHETNPNDDSLFHYEGPPIMTLQTCSGLWYQNRLLMTFDLVEVT